MKKNLDKARERAGRFLDRLRPESRSQSPAVPDPDGPGPLTSPPYGPYADTGDAQYPHPSSEPSLPVWRGTPGYMVDDTVNTITTPNVDMQLSPTAALAAGSIVQNFLAAAQQGSDLCLPLKVALVGSVKIFEICERTADLRDQYKTLASRLAHLGAVTGVLSERTQFDPKLKQRLESIAELFSRLTAVIEAMQRRGTVRRVIESQADVAEVKGLLLKISERVEAFIYESMIRVGFGVDVILARIPADEEEEFKKDFASWDATVKIIGSALGGRCVHNAEHDAQPKDAGCMAGTRVSVLSKFVDWVKDSPKRIFWLAGMAGTGKTSIAISICRMLQEDPDVLLGGTFFCSRTSNDEARSDGRRIIPTLAAFLADQSPTFAAKLAAELKLNSGAAAHKPISEQIVPLLQQPLAALASESRPIVFVIDALDECSNERELHVLLKAIATFTCPARVRFILTSRPETYIVGSQISDQVQNEILQLHTIAPEEVSEDIRLYIDRTFGQSSVVEDWYSEADIRALTSLSNGLFIFAFTVITYILDTDSGDDRKARLQTVLSNMKNNLVATGPLDAMYEFVLIQASSPVKVEPQERERTWEMLACILTARMPLSVEALAELLAVRAETLRASLRRVRAVVYVPDQPDQPALRTLHASFDDYLFERAPPQMRVSRSLADEMLARGSLQVMAKRLYFNVSHIRSSYQSNPAKAPTSITLALEYACMQWIYHIADISNHSALQAEVERVFCSQFMFWLEVASVLHRVGRAAAMLHVALSTFRHKELTRFLRDASEFVASSRAAIEMSASHIYLSALPFAPKDSLIYQKFGPLCSDLVSVESFGVDRYGSRLVMTFTGHEAGVTSVTCSPDGHRLLASGSRDGTVRIWDTHTGEEIMSPLRSGDGKVWSVSFHPTGRFVASGTEVGAVCVWRLLDDQGSLQRLIGHSGMVLSVVFSPDGHLLASSSSDKTIRLWMIDTHQQLAVLNGHMESVLSVAFSPDGRILASGSDDCTIRLWHSSSGEPMGQPMSHGRDNWVLSVAFSPDGSKIASSSVNDIRLWEVQSGMNVATMNGHSDWIGSVQFAPDGLSLVSSSYDRSLRLWKLPQDGLEAASTILDGHTDVVDFVTFSPDGFYITSASDDHTLRMWDAESSQQVVKSLEAHDDVVHSVVVSPDGLFIVSGSRDLSVRVSDPRNGEPKLPPLLGHKKEVLSVAISPDGRMIASASSDCTIRIWDAHTGEAIGEPLQGHSGAINTVIFSPDTRLLVSGSEDETVRFWDAETGHSSRLDPLVCGGRVSTVALSPDSLLLAVGDCHGRIHLWHVSTGLPARSPFDANLSFVHSIAFSPDGAHIVSCGSGTAICIWDISSGHLVLALEGQMWTVRSVAYSSDGQFIASGSDDCTVNLWNAATGTLVATLHGHGHSVRSVAFTPDARSIVSCSSDKTIRVWDVQESLSLSENTSENIVAAFPSTKLQNGWLLGPSGELLMWVPVDYRHYLQVTPCVMLIGHRRISVAVNDGGRYRGKNWTDCWRG